jgi:hypothetical protein
MTPKQYRKKSVVITAVLWNGDSGVANAFIGESFGTDWYYESRASMNIIIPTLEGNMLCKVGDYIIKGVKGEFYPCKPDIFEATYELTE